MDAFRYDTSSCRAGSTDSIHPWHGDHRATQEQNHAISHTPRACVCHLTFGPVLRCASIKHWSFERGGQSSRTRSDVMSSFYQSQSP
ncbi:hypothetical protein V8C40DRAFT_233264 [Trichoderma camerunense]